MAVLTGMDVFAAVDRALAHLFCDSQTRRCRHHVQEHFLEEMSSKWLLLVSERI